MSDVLKQSKNLIYFTILYNLVEGIIALTVGIDENSTALLSFGLDSFIETSKTVPDAKARISKVLALASSPKTTNSGVFKVPAHFP